MAKDKDTFIPVPGGEVRAENPDGISTTQGNRVRHNLWDRNDPPAITSGDWQTRNNGIPQRSPNKQ